MIRNIQLLENHCYYKCEPINYTAKETSLKVMGVRLFNILPTVFRNANHGNVLMFKNNLDHFLCEVPDQPTMQPPPPNLPDWRLEFYRLTCYMKLLDSFYNKRTNKSMNKICYKTEIC